MTDQQPPPAFCMNPWAASGETVTLIHQGVRGLVRRFRTWREVRSLNRIGVLQVGWDAAGRQAVNSWRTDPF